jgi:ubiquinone/menaquinone biosynthesis C-methylase UbiE
MNRPENPWLEIPIAEYVGHMSDSHVRQYEMLNTIFRQAYSNRQPEKLLVLGISDGNGLEHISKKITRKIIVIDINPEYLAVAQRTFHTKLPQLDFICEDVDKYKFPANYFDMIHGALIFEYVDYQKLLVKIAKSLKIGGVLSTVIQLEDEKVSKISETKFKSLKKLASIMKIVDINTFKNYAFNNNLREIHKEIIKPYGEKSFYYRIFERIR